MTDSASPGAGPLTGKVAWVAGATRASGRAIAVELGAAGAVVYGTGRSTREGASDMNRPETIEETAQLVDSAGGRGHAIRCDHTDAADIDRALTRIRTEQGRLDILVNDVWGGDPLTEWDTAFWELDTAKVATMWERAVWSHVLTSRAAVPLMIETGPGLVVEMTDGDGSYYRGNLAYDLAKTAVNRLALAQAEELRPHGVSAVAVTPGFIRSEAILEHFGVTEETWRDGAAVDPHFAASETPHFVGRCIAALASDPEVSARSGLVLTSWDLAEEYGVNDVDGRRPHWGRYFDEHVRGG